MSKDTRAVIELRRTEARMQHKLTERQLSVLEHATERLSGVDWQGLHDVFTALERKGFVAFKNPTAPAPRRGYSVTPAGYAVVRPIQDAQTAHRRAEDDERHARYAAEEEDEAKRLLMLDGGTYHSNESTDDVIRRELGIDKILAEGRKKARL